MSTGSTLRSTAFSESPWPPSIEHSSKQDSVSSMFKSLHLSRIPSSAQTSFDRLANIQRTILLILTKCLKMIKPIPASRDTRLLGLVQNCIDCVGGVIYAQDLLRIFARLCGLNLPPSLPISSPYPGPSSVLIMDNARIHHRPDIEKLVLGYGCHIEYLLLYSPDVRATLILLEYTQALQVDERNVGLGLREKMNGESEDAD
ncbi:hypothetical protein BDN71DRAFT_1429352 [Pleurotus eryngii]|uniref:Tc1-like transposase DDE domain-containing protein n=1 Tax=Pleurotus eryngii TaxID=5323 RepID=A0A9P6DID9_PLEER|nr:hypothetical protein BDN71DRAFT_1429352 [Pleurotus eryngii]